MAIDKLFFTDALKNFIKRRLYVTDGTVFRLHYRVTALVLIVFSILLSTTQFFGDPIQCIEISDVPSKILNSYCWVEGTFSLPRAWDKEVGVEVVYAGVDTRNPEDEIVLHAYYQWVCFTLLLQAALFYIPRLVWSNWEGGRIRNLLQELNCPIVPKCEKQKKFCNLITYFTSDVHDHTSYALRYLFCEFLSLVNVVGQICLMNAFLGGTFTTYGLDVVKFSLDEQVSRTDPMIKVFPRLTKCRFHNFGPSGDVQKYDALCLLPLNIVNEKIYIMLWFWFILLSLFTCLSVIYRIVLLFWPSLRYMTLHAFSRLTPEKQLRSILKKSTYGDWFVLLMLAKNMDTLNFKDFIGELYKNIDSPVTSTESDLSAA